jgi:hypothetical protein
MSYETGSSQQSRAPGREGGELNHHLSRERSVRSLDDPVFDNLRKSPTGENPASRGRRTMRAGEKLGTAGSISPGEGKMLK